MTRLSMEMTHALHARAVSVADDASLSFIFAPLTAPLANAILFQDAGQLTHIADISRRAPMISLVAFSVEKWSEERGHLIKTANIEAL